MHCVVHRQAIAKGLQDRPKHLVGIPFFHVRRFRNTSDPLVRFLRARFDDSRPWVLIAPRLS
jgi:hypothetical protein